MLDSGIGENVNVVIQTMGTKEWQEHDISSDTAQTYIIKNGELVLVRDDLWYLYEDDILYLYDEETDTTCYYDEYEDQIYAYDEESDDWYPIDE